MKRHKIYGDNKGKPAREALEQMRVLIANIDNSEHPNARVFHLIAIAHLTTALMLLEVAQSSRRGVRDAQALVKKTIRFAHLVAEVLESSTCR